MVRSRNHTRMKYILRANVFVLYLFSRSDFFIFISGALFATIDQNVLVERNNFTLFNKSNFCLSFRYNLN